MRDTAQVLSGGGKDQCRKFSKSVIWQDSQHPVCRACVRMCVCVCVYVYMSGCLFIRVSERVRMVDIYIHIDVP